MSKWTYVRAPGWRSRAVVVDLHYAGQNALVRFAEGPYVGQELVVKRDCLTEVTSENNDASTAKRVRRGMGA